MKRWIPILAALLVLAATPMLRAQVETPPPPTPPADPHQYVDPGMSYTAPPEAVLLGRRMVTLDQLGQDLQPVAGWALNPGKEDMRVIQLQMESFTGDPAQWETQFESQTHNQIDGALIKHQTPMALLNGMPAHFVEVTFGSGFTAKKMYAVVWADGQRGISLSETARVGEASPEEAKRVLNNVTAVRYPIDRI